MISMILFPAIPAHSRATTADKVSAWMFAKFKTNDGCRQLAGTVSRSARRMGPAVREL